MIYSLRQGYTTFEEQYIGDKEYIYILEGIYI